MVAANIALPNIRKLFKPDLGYTIVDADLAGADAQVVAWDANALKLKAAFKRGEKIHIFNARTMWPELTESLSDKEIKEHPNDMYRRIKAGVHATNYGALPPALVERVGMEIKESHEFQERWFFSHPEIKEWHHRTQRHLDGTQCWNCDNLDITLGRPCNLCGVTLGGTIKNPFGFRRKYFDRIDRSLLNEALAWKPQSTVALCTEIGWTSIAHGPDMEMLTGLGKWNTISWEKYLVDPTAWHEWHHVVQFLIQVHDSIVFQIPFAYEKDLPEIVKAMEVRIPFDDPLIIPLGYGMSRKSWGNIKD